MKKIILYSVGLLLAMASCVNDDSDLQTLIENNPGRIIPPEIRFDDSDLDEGLDVIVTDPADDRYNDYWENSPWTVNVKVNYTPEGVSVTGVSTRVKATVEGGHVTIRSTASRVHITLSGECNDGSVKVYSDYKYKMTLNGLNLTNPRGAAINNQCGKSLYLVVAPGSVNSLTDGEEYAPAPDDEDMKGTVFSEGQIVVSGGGWLRVYCKGGRHAIASDDYIRFRKGNKIEVVGIKGNGIRGKDGVYIDGSVINVASNAQGGRAITTNAFLSITGGRVVAMTTGSPIIDAALSDTTSAAGIKCDSLMTVTGGTLRIKSEGEGGKGINAHSNLFVSGGNVLIVTTGAKGNASPKGIKCDSTMTVQAGSLYVYSAHTSPVHAHPLNISPGYTDYTDKPRLFQLQYPAKQ